MCEKLARSKDDGSGRDQVAEMPDVQRGKVAGARSHRGLQHEIVLRVGKAGASLLAAADNPATVGS